MMPVNDAYPVEQLIQTVRRYQETTAAGSALNIPWCAVSMILISAQSSWQT